MREVDRMPTFKFKSKFDGDLRTLTLGRNAFDCGRAISSVRHEIFGGLIVCSMKSKDLVHWCGRESSSCIRLVNKIVLLRGFRQASSISHSSKFFQFRRQKTWNLGGVIPYVDFHHPQSNNKSKRRREKEEKWRKG
jgi:hypothetical protein